MLRTNFPAKRLQTIEDAGRQRVPFTTGILIGIGETPEERVDALLAIRDLHDRYGHIQEVIIQNFRAKPDIPMQNWPEPTQGEMLRTSCGCAPADAEDEHSSATESFGAVLRGLTGCRHQRLGRSFAPDAGFH